MPGHLERAAEWLAEAGGAASPGELGAALGLQHTTQAAVVRQLRQAGLAEGPKHRVSLTAEGWARAGARDGATAGAVVDAAAAGWPYAHRAFLELLCSAVVARRHLAAVRRRGHLGFMAIGETGLGKTALAEMACYLFGLDWGAVRRFLYSETPGSLLGRRDRDGDGTYRLVQSELAGLPLLLLDEFDKGAEPERRAAWAFFQGETAGRHEGESWPLRPVPVLTANPPASGARYGLLRPEYRRRCVVLDTGYARGRGGEIGDMLAGWYATARPGALRLDALTPPGPRLGDQALQVLRLARDQILTDAGREEFPGTDALELAALGRMALMGTADEMLAAYLTAEAYLQVTGTVPGQVTPGWQLDMAAVRRFGQSGAPLAEAVERGRAGRAEASRVRRAASTAAEVAGDELTAAIGELTEQLRLAAAPLQPRRLGGLDDTRMAAAAGVRATIQKLARETPRCRSRAGLDALRDRAAAPLAAAAATGREAAAARDQAARDKRAGTTQARQDRRTAAAAASADRDRDRARRQALAAQLAGVVAAARELEALYTRSRTRPEDSPFRQLRKLTGPDGRSLLAYQDGAGWRQPGRWTVRGNGLWWPGSLAGCKALNSWGPATQAVLAVALAPLHRDEDQLRDALGRKPRQRPAVSVPAAGTAAAVPASARPAPAAGSALLPGQWPGEPLG